MSTQRAGWQDLYSHYESLSSVHLKDLFQADPERFSRFSVRQGDILLDYSKQRVTTETMQKLCGFAKEQGLSEQIKAMFSGQIVNPSEQRPALHVVLRDLTPEPLLVNGRNIKSDVQNVLARVEAFAEGIRSGAKKGSTGKRFTDIISLGIGGSDLGPAMVCEALQEYKTTDITLHFISNVDGKSLATLLKKLDPATTLCIINSKTFTTPETLQNAKAIKKWLAQTLGEKNNSLHLVGVTANQERAESFGLLKDQIFEFWDFVGGRYSVWSSVGLPIAILLGMPNFRAFLAGAHEMDQHFYSAPFAENMPVLMALLGLWNINFAECATQAIIPYDDGLRKFPDYLQQLEMESNGKKAKKDSGFVSYSTAPVIWGGVGCNGQHAYMQLLHQGTQVIPVDFLIAAHGHPEYEAHHQLLVGSCLSQSKALMEGTPTEALAADHLQHAKICFGNRPSTTVMYTKLTPHVLGALVALYEHKVFVQGVLWGINSFDQWGVELGKKLVKEILPYLESSAQTASLDSSTNGLINFFNDVQRKLY